MPEHFFIAGAQRSATTYLYQLCAAHPQIEMAKPVKPEPKFFLLDSLYELGMEHYKNTYFSEKPGVKALGEKSTSYMSYEKVAQRISSNLPSAKIIFLLREPIQRALSHYVFSVNNGFETLPLDQAFFREKERRENYNHSAVSDSPYAYLRRGCYMDFIEIYEKYFPPEQILIILHEHLIHSKEYLTTLYSFLDVDPDCVPVGLSNKVNANEDKPDISLSANMKAYLKEYFSESNERLAKRLSISLTEWQE